MKKLWIILSSCIALVLAIGGVVVLLNRGE